MTQPFNPQRRRFVVNGLSAHTGGGLTYLTEQIKAISALADDPPELKVFATAPLARACAGLPGVEIRELPILPLPIRLVVEQFALPLLARHADAVYCPGNFAIAMCPVPQVVAFQNPNHFGSQARDVRRTYYPRSMRIRKRVEAWAARWSIRLCTTSLAISESLRSTILEDVEQPGDLRLLLSATPQLPVIATASKNGGYALTVANDYPHKDWDGLIELFTSWPDLPKLVIVGEPRGRLRRRGLDRRIAASNLPNGVELRGPVDNREAMAELYAGAQIYIAHSRLEAFPLTPYEAMSSGTPVLASDIAPHREVCGDGARYYPVDDRDALGRLVASSDHAPPADPPDLSRTWHDNAAELMSVLDAASP